TLSSQVRRYHPARQGAYPWPLLGQGLRDLFSNHWSEAMGDAGEGQVMPVGDAPQVAVCRRKGGGASLSHWTSAAADPPLFELLEDGLERGIHRHGGRLLFLGTELPLELPAGTARTGSGPGPLLALLPVGKS